MFGKRNSASPEAALQPQPTVPEPAAPVPARPEAAEAAERSQTPRAVASAPAEAPPAPVSPHPAVRKSSERVRSEEYYDVKTTVFNALIDTIDLTQLSKLDAEAAREEIRDIVGEIVAIKNVVMSIAEQEELLEDICNDVLGYGPLEPLLVRDDIADIMINGAETTYIEVGGKVEAAPVRFASNAQLMNICQRIVSQVGRRVDESSPICDARLPDGSAAALDRRTCAHDPQVQEGQVDPRTAGTVRFDQPRGAHASFDYRPRSLQRHHLGWNRFR